MEEARGGWQGLQPLVPEQWALKGKKLGGNYWEVMLKLNTGLDSAKSLDLSSCLRINLLVLHSSEQHSILILNHFKLFKKMKLQDTTLVAGNFAYPLNEHGIKNCYIGVELGFFQCPESDCLNSVSQAPKFRFSFGLVQRVEIYSYP